MDFETYLATLAQQLAGKDPGRLKKRNYGTIVLVLDDLDGTPRRATITIEKRSVRVDEGALEATEGLGAVVRGRLGSWLAFFHDSKVERMRELSLNGDIELLDTIADLLALKHSPLALQARPRTDRD